jgi:hypothetical protein
MAGSRRETRKPEPPPQARGASVVLYAVDLDELRRWVGCKDEAKFREAWSALGGDEESDWEPEELEVLERLLRRVIFEGKLYAGLADEERYYLTQLLIDLFDEYVDADPLSDDIPLDRLLRSVDAVPMPAKGWGERLARGRELDGEAPIWTSGPVEEVLSYMGYVTRQEAPVMAVEVGRVVGRGGRIDANLKQLLSAAEECARAELDLVSFVG